MQILNLSKITYKSQYQISVDGLQLLFTLYYDCLFHKWYFDFEYNDHKLVGHALNIGINLLSAFSKVLPFGIYCYTTNGSLTNPIAMEDLQKERVKVAILDKDEVEAIEENV